MHWQKMSYLYLWYTTNKRKEINIRKQTIQLPWTAEEDRFLDVFKFYQPLT